MNHTITFLIDHRWTFYMTVSDAPDKDSAKMAAANHLAVGLQDEEIPFLQVMNDEGEEYFLRKSKITHFRVENVATHYEDYVETTATATTTKEPNAPSEGD